MSASATDGELCRRFGIAIYQVGEVYDTDRQGRPISNEEKGKWFVSAPEGMFPTWEIEAIPLSGSEREAQTLAVTSLGLRELQVDIDTLVEAKALP